MDFHNIIQDEDLVALSDSEYAEISGGFWFIPLGIGLAISAINNFEDIRQGLADGFAGTPNPN